MKKEDMVICVHGGHALKGAIGAVGLISESVYDRKIAKAVIERLKEKGYVAYDCSVDTGSSSDVLRGIKLKSQKYGATHNISIHMNSYVNNKASGFEICTSTPKVYDKMCKQISTKLNMANRGCKKRTDLYVINQLTNCVLLEVGFVTSKSDVKKIKLLTPEKIGVIIADSYIRNILKASD